MKLYYAPGTCALGVHIVLEWIGEAYEAEHVTLGDPEYLKINPLGTVPVLQAEGRLLNQADAILKYLVNTYPGANLGGDGTPLGEHDLDRWLAFLTGDFHPAFYPVFSPQRYTTQIATAELDAVKGAGHLLVAKFLAHLNEHLQDRAHLALEKRSVADPYAFAMLRWARPLDKYPNVQRFFDAMLEDSGVQTAMKAQGID